MNLTRKTSVTGKFDDVGIAQGAVDESLGPLQAMRLFVHSETENWAILSEVRMNKNRLARERFKFRIPFQVFPLVSAECVSRNFQGNYSSLNSAGN